MLHVYVPGPAKLFVVQMLTMHLYTYKSRFGGVRTIKEKPGLSEELFCFVFSHLLSVVVNFHVV